MGLVETIKEKLLAARKNRDELAKNVLSVVLGDIQIQQGRFAQKGAVTEEQAEKIVEKLIKSNEETMHCFPNDTSIVKLETENAILTALLPIKATEDEIRARWPHILKKSRVPKVMDSQRELLSKSLRRRDLKPILMLLSKLFLNYERL